MAFKPEACLTGDVQVLEQNSGEQWMPLVWHKCSFPPEIFSQVMLNLIRNPNINSSKLFRADISLDRPFTENFDSNATIIPMIAHFKGFDLKRVMVRTMIPRNAQLDKSLDQTCLIFQNTRDSGEIETLVIYLPHISSSSEAPFYHPAVHGIGHLHIFDPQTQKGVISVHYSFFDSEDRSEKLVRTAQHLLAVLYKHGQGTAAGYVKRVQHDVLIPQATVQNTYAKLKAKYAKILINNWAEATDPTKHVFEDLSIATFLIELWRDMYKDTEFPGFVDIGCGNGLLVHILLGEGYSGWGFDARKRKSWETFSTRTQENLKELVLIPSIIQTRTDESDHPQPMDQSATNETPGIHNGVFPKGTFIISNHADELTPWTPILANLSESPFMMIPCCSHALSGARFRAPPSKEAGASNSAYASLVAWVSKLATACGWEVEKEMLRIPSTRNTALLGRQRAVPFADVDVRELVRQNGGANGWEENAMKLVKTNPRRH